MEWKTIFHNDFEAEFDRLPFNVRKKILAYTKLLRDIGPQLSRPQADTLEGSKHSNMKELRFSAADGVWRVAFAFDTKRKAILLTAGDKAGQDEKRFYQKLIKTADDRFSEWLERTSGDQ